MTPRTKLIMASTAGMFALAACTPIETQTGNENQRTQEGALIGAAAGAAIGILTGDDAGERRRLSLIHI